MELRQKWHAFYEVAEQNPSRISYPGMHSLDILSHTYIYIPKYSK